MTVDGERKAESGKTQALLKEMALLLATDDTAANDLFEAKRALLVETFGTQALMLGRQMANFDCPGALVTLQTLIPPDPAN